MEIKKMSTKEMLASEIAKILTSLEGESQHMQILIMLTAIISILLDMIDLFKEVKRK